MGVVSGDEVNTGTHVCSGEEAGGSEVWVTSGGDQCAMAYVMFNTSLSPWGWDIRRFVPGGGRYSSYFVGFT